jgi:SAM-dependent methyltransferase
VHVTEPNRFDRLVHEAQAQRFEGWDFSWLAGRMIVAPPSWDYPSLARREFTSAHRMLDMGTGGGELLASLGPLPRQTVATESYHPNLAIARRRLGSLGVHVVAAPNDTLLPFDRDCFDLVINRHEAFDPREVARVLKPGGVFLTQQVGGEHFAGLNEALGAEPYPYRQWRLTIARMSLPLAGLEVLGEMEEHPPGAFLDIGAVVYYLRATPWQIPSFSVERYGSRLADLHTRIEREGALRLRSHIFLIRAAKK